MRELDFLGKREIGVAIETIVKPGQIQTVTSCDSHILAWLPRSCNIKAEAANTGYTQIQHLKESLLVLQEFLYEAKPLMLGPASGLPRFNQIAIGLSVSS